MFNQERNCTPLSFPIHSHLMVSRCEVQNNFHESKMAYERPCVCVGVGGKTWRKVGQKSTTLDVVTSMR
jgi:hypothetical protein